MKLPKLPKPTVYFLVAVLVLLAIVTSIVILVPRTSPLDAFVTRRTCDFVQLGDLHAAICTDQTYWTVAPFTP